MLGRIQIAEGNLTPVRKTFQENIIALQEHNSLACLAHGLEAFARLALAEHDPDLAVRLLGAVEAYLESLKMSMIPAEKILYDQTVASARLALPEKAFAFAWQQGRAIKFDDVLAQVMEQKNE